MSANSCYGLQVNAWKLTPPGRGSRDRLTFSKSILKRYLRECLDRDAMIGAPWIVKPSIAHAFGIPIQQKMEAIERVHQDREAKLAKRRRTYTPLSEKVPRGFKPPPRKPKLGEHAT